MKHRTITLNDITIFYREAGPEGAPVVLLPHGYPSSSFQYRNLIPALADKWHVIALDFPGFGYSDTPEDFSYTFDGYAEFLDAFAQQLGLKKYALYLHDYGSQIGLRLAMRNPERITGLIIQNGDIYEDALGPRYNALKAYWQQPTPEGKAKLRDAVSEEGFRDEFTDGLSKEVAERVAPDMWRLSGALLLTKKRREIMVGLMEGLKTNLQWMPKAQAYLREQQPPTLIVWGPRDGYMPEAAARAYLRDLPNAELHLLPDGSHWLLETHLDEVVSRVRNFLEKTSS
ncbi:MAG TPA: alpha/beta hydrolase [Verrucomicrobiae bacterium]|nr:alpha/beta hydrolase [Verrucomicrobiae bacterium]